MLSRRVVQALLARSVLAACVGQVLSGCVVGAETRPPRHRVQRGPIAPPETAAGYLAAEERVVPRGDAAEPRAERPPGAVWYPPHVVWSGVEYVVVPGRWESPEPAYTWR